MNNDLCTQCTTVQHFKSDKSNPQHQKNPTAVQYTMMSTSEEIAQKTLECLKKNVPNEVSGIAFLSGGQSEQEASRNLDSINKINDTNFLITFSYGRALQQSALKTWSKEMGNVKAIHNVFNHRAEMNSLASKGEWSQSLEI